jgi:hypothetical protein
MSERDPKPDMANRPIPALTLVALFGPLLRAKMACCGRPNSELTMLRWMMPFLIAILAIPATAEAAGPAGKAAARRAASQLPPGLPRAKYKSRTTVAPAAPYPSAQSLYDGPDVMFTPSVGYVRYIRPVAGVVLVPAYPAWPGYSGPSIDYQGPWYAGRDVTYWNGWPYGYGCGLNSYGNPWC